MNSDKLKDLINIQTRNTKSIAFAINSGVTPYLNGNEVLEFLAKDVPDSSHIVFSWVEYKINVYNEVLWKELDYKIKKLWKDWHLKLFKAEIDHFKGKDIRSRNNWRSEDKSYNPRKYIRNKTVDIKNKKKLILSKIEQIILKENKINKLNSEDFGRWDIIISKADQLIVDYNLYVEELLPVKYNKNKIINADSDDWNSISSLNQL